MVGDRNTKTLCVLERETHQKRIGDRASVVGDRDRARVHHLSDRCEALPRAAHRDATDGIHARRLRPAPLGGDEADRRRVVHRRIGVRHRAHRSESPGGRGTSAGRDRFLVLPARLAQVDVHVDEPWGHKEAGTVNDACVLRGVDLLTQGGHHPVSEQNVSDPVQILTRVENPSTFEQKLLAHASPPCFAASALSWRPPASRYRTAMRIATPLVT